MMARLTLDRNSICAADDFYDHRRAIEVDLDRTLAEILGEIVRTDYLPVDSSWAVYLNDRPVAAIGGMTLASEAVVITLVDQLPPWGELHLNFSYWPAATVGGVADNLRITLGLPVKSSRHP